MNDNLDLVWRNLCNYGIRFLYSCLWYLGIFIVIPYLLYRSIRLKQYRRNLNERFWCKKKFINKKIIWIHAVSVGETRAIANLVALIKQELSEHKILITNMTPTGRATALKLYPDAMIRYLPYDMPHVVARFFKHFRPEVGLIVETEIWPNYINCAHKMDIPLMLINARLSQKSYQNYKRFGFIFDNILNKFKFIVCQNTLSLEHFAMLGVYKQKLLATHSMKFDNTPDGINKLEWMTHSLKKIVVWISTRDKEEELILQQLQNNLDAQVIHVIVPRHPDRFSAVLDLIKQSGLKYQVRSHNEPLKDDTTIVLGDSMGEVFAYCNIAFLCVVGGSFVECGCHSPIEPLSLGKPTIVGRSIYNFRQNIMDAKNASCLEIADDINDCFMLIKLLCYDLERYKIMQDAAFTFINQFKGSSAKILDIIKCEILG